jgi:LPXTG-site transpeptidase (sortase) family protein
MGNGPFRYLQDLNPGEIISLQTEENVYTYQVREQFTVDPADIGITQPTVKPQITLITCTGWDDEDDFYRSRQILIADLVRTSQSRRMGSSKPV